MDDFEDGDGHVTGHGLEDESDHESGDGCVRGVVLNDEASFCGFYRGSLDYFCVGYNSCSISGSMCCANSYSSGYSN